MREFDPVKIRPEVEIEAEKKQEYKHLGSMKNLHQHPLWQYDPYKDKVIEVKINKKQIMVNLKGKAVKSARAEINPRLPMYFALNYKNARRKADNIKAKIFNEMLKIRNAKKTKKD